MIEIEVKLPISSDMEMREKLAVNGYSKGNTLRETDIYFNGPDRNFRETDEAFRIRKVEVLEEKWKKFHASLEQEDMCSQKTFAYLTYKGKKMDQTTMTRKELETQVKDYDTTMQMLLALGYQPVKPVIKVREEYHGEDAYACLDYVEELGYFLELEIMAQGENGYEAGVRLIEEELQKFGYTIGDTVTTSYLSMLEQNEG